MDDNRVMISAKSGFGIDRLLSLIEKVINENKKECILVIPYDKQNLVNGIYKEYSVKATDYTDLGVEITCVLDSKGQGIYKDYFKNED